MIKVYGIKNCDTVKKSLNWLSEHQISFEFVDYKKVGVDQKKMVQFLKKFGHEKLINRKGTTWKQLSLDEQNNVVDDQSALELMLLKPSLIKRPIVDLGVDLGDEQLLGFDEEQYRQFFKL